MINTRRGRSGGGFTAYLEARGSTFAFVGFFLEGLLAGSIFSISAADSAQLLRSIIMNELALQMERSLWQLMVGSAAGLAGILIFVYLCINCSKGAWLIYLVPLVHGLSAGSLITVILYSYSYSAFFYVMLGIFVPKLIQTLLLLSLCNKSARYCKEQFGSPAARHRGREVFPIWLYLMLFGVYCALESLLIFTFRGLLSY